ncbi:MAG: DMT family transporter [Alphaproteobacteria bacterium]|nr:DMT family transporter [Alphaproteobacteria bacterium]TAD92261.1 MAG: DMT family transporter [Alphaproteobacteria bacterium]
MAPGSPAAGIVAMLAASFAFSWMSVAGKWLADDYPVGEIVFFRSLFALLPLAIVIHRAGGFTTLKTHRLGGHLRRGSLGIVAMGGHFVALGMMPLAELTTINFTGPLFIVALSALVLREVVGTARWTAVIVGFLGVLIVARPGLDSGFVGLGAGIALVGSLAYAFAIITTRQLARTERDSTIVFYNLTSCTVAFGLTLPFAWVTPSWPDLLIFIGMGVAGGLGQYWMTRAYHIGPTALVAPFSYASLLWAVLNGIVVFADWPDVTTLVGAGVVVLSGVALLRAEQTKE